MKKIFSHNITRVVAGTVLGIILLGGGVYGLVHVSAGANDNVHGWLWSDAPTQSDQNMTCSDNDCGRGFGWISMNSVDTGAGGNYGVNLDMTTGKLVGKAWSEFAGFLQFDVNGPFPTGTGTDNSAARVNPTCLNDTSYTTCNVTGWARFMEAPASNQAGGWDGWVSLGGQATNGSTYGVVYTKATKKFSGKAWGDINAGWIDFGVPNDGAYVESTDVCPDETGYPATIGMQASLPTGYHFETITVYPHTGPMQPGGGHQQQQQQYTVQTVCRPNTLPDLCSNFSGVQSTLPVQINNVWYSDADGDGTCTTMPDTLLCQDATASNYGSPLPCNIPITPANDLCTNLAGTQITLPYYNPGDSTWYADPNGDKVCTKTSDICSIAPGNQTPNGTNTWNVGGVWYGLSNNVCIVDACPDTSDFETQNFQAYVPFTGSNGSTYIIDTDGVCKKQTESTGGTGAGTKPGKPIYKEN
jgi:hypothetical protein